MVLAWIFALPMDCMWAWKESDAILKLQSTINVMAILIFLMDRKGYILDISIGHHTLNGLFGANIALIKPS